MSILEERTQIKGGGTIKGDVNKSSHFPIIRENVEELGWLSQLSAQFLVSAPVMISGPWD